jgi:hypothetical protein
MNRFTPQALVVSIRLLERRLASILEDEAMIILEQVVAKLEGASDVWDYQIHPERPLRFKPCPIGGLRIQPDIFCKISGTAGQNPTLKEQNVVIRIWSISESLSFRKDWDAPQLIGAIKSQSHRRVVSRYHFDYANPGQDGPRFHFQVGGKAESNEYCWLPEVIDIPRIAHPPLDLILACEMILANFYPSEFQRLSRQPDWISAVRKSEGAFQLGYYDLCRNTIGKASDMTKAGTLLSNLWNTPR